MKYELNWIDNILWTFSKKQFNNGVLEIRTFGKQKYFECDENVTEKYIDYVIKELGL